jgi:hypothetical protein
MSRDFTTGTMTACEPDSEPALCWELLGLSFGFMGLSLSLWVLLRLLWFFVLRVQTFEP